MARHTKKVTAEDRAKAAERQREYRARKKAEQELQNITSSTHSIDEPTSITSTAGTTDAPEHQQIEGGNTRKRSSSKKAPRTEEEQKEYNRTRKREYRAREKTIDGASSATSTTVTTDAQLESQQVKEEVTLGPSSSKRTPQTEEERKEYDRKRKREYRAKKSLAKTTAVTSGKTPDAVDIEEQASTSVAVESTTDKDQTPAALPSPKRDSNQVADRIPGGGKNCKVRIGFGDILEVETKAVVIPFYGELSLQSGGMHQRLLSQYSRTHPDETADFTNKFDNEWQDNLNDYGAEAFEWNIPTNTGIHRTTIHVKPPQMRGEALTLASETHLKASYLACLHEAEKSGCDSLAFPLLGYGVEPRRTVAIGIQIIFAYMQSVKETNLQLIYLIVKLEENYDDLGDFLSYVREFDLSKWTDRGMYFDYENYIFDKVKKQVYYATIPGTDMVWRCFKMSKDKRGEAAALADMRKIHDSMLARTKISYNNFQRYVGSTRRGRVNGTEFIQNGYQHFRSTNLLNIQFDMDHFCGSNAVLRKLWLISFYYMYRNSHITEKKLKKEENIKLRKRIFKQQKWTHHHVLKMWKDTLKYAPHQCSCLKIDGIHENQMVFVTPMSHRDQFFEDWILDSRVLIFNLDETDPLANIQNYELTFTHGDGKHKSIAGAERIVIKRYVKDRMNVWTKSVPEVLKRQRKCFEELSQSNAAYLMESAGNDEILETYDPISLDEVLDKSDAQYRFRSHLFNDLEVERCFRNRFFRFCFPAQLDATYGRRQVLNADGEMEDIPDVDDDEFWKLNYNTDKDGDEDEDDEDDDGKACTVDVYISRKLHYFGIEVFYVPPTAHCHVPGQDPLPTIRVSVDPKALDIGDPTEQCQYCNASMFKSERRCPACKNGAVWVPFLKRLPAPINKLFAKKSWGPKLISCNAAFSMASIQYNRDPQAPKGIQTMKYRGLISAHPSAVTNKQNVPPLYANFIVLQCSNKQIAEERLKSLRGKTLKALRVIFEEIQEYLDKNNRLYETYKSMKEIEKELLDGKSGYLDNNQITFRIVPPGELTEDQIRALENHPGVYARESRMGDGYISVAYTYDADVTMLPRGLNVYPRNPNTNPRNPNKKKEDPIAPISIYSDLAELMAYTLFFPDAVGGWGLHKYPRLADDEPKILFRERVRRHLEELHETGGVARDYFESDQSSTDEPKEPAAEVDEMAEVDGMAEVDERAQVDEMADEMDENVGNLMEDNAEEMDVAEEDILPLGQLEDLQEFQINDNDVQEPALVVVEKKGNKYVIADRSRKPDDIPVACINPFGADSPRNSSSDEEEAPVRSRFDDGTDNHVYKGDTTTDESGGEEDIQQFQTDVRDVDIEAPGEDAEVAAECVAPDEDDVPSEEVCYGDEHNAEPNADARANDGVRVKNVGKRKYISLGEYTNFGMYNRRGIPTRFQGRSKRLGQLYTIDMAIRILEQRMKALTEHRAEFPMQADHRTLFKVYKEMVKKKFKGKKKLGMLVTMPSTVPGTSKYQRELVMSAVKVSNDLGNPHLFITFTGNPKWPEIEREAKRWNCSWADIPSHVNRVFKLKFEAFLDDVLGMNKKMSSQNGKYVRQPGMFGEVNWFNYSVEFQTRGMPHCHLLISLKDPITEVSQIDEIISAEVPDFPTDPKDPGYEDQLRYHNLVRDMMTHRPCQNDPQAYCMLEKKAHWKQCTKGFPHKLTDYTTTSDNRYPKYKRTSKNHFVLQRGAETLVAGSEYVVAHNRELLMKYECHINVESVSSIKTMKYMFKYIHKGSDRVLLEAKERIVQGTDPSSSMLLDRNVFVPANLNPAKVLQRQREAEQQMRRGGFKVDKDKHVVLNDTSYMLDMSAMTANEAAWKIASYPMHGSSHIVHRAYIHEEGKKVYKTTRGVDIASAERLLARKELGGMMEAWFAANRKPDKLPGNKGETTDLTLDEMFKYYIFDNTTQRFRLRERDYSARILGRIQAPQPKWLELTAVRLLAQTVRGPTSFEALRTYNGKVYDTCLEAARARRLMNGDIEWDNALDEIAKTASPIECRRFFASILVHCAPANPQELWDKHWRQLVNPKYSWTEDQQKAHALRHIKFLLARHGMALSDFELEDDFNELDMPTLTDPDDEVDNPDKTDQFSRSYHHKEGERMYKLLRGEQKKFVDRVLKLAKKGRVPRMIFVDGPGGTGKTFCYQCIYHKLKALGQNGVCISHTGVAACLLPGGCTVHRKFSVPLEMCEFFKCNVALGSTEGDLLALLDFAIWDEICMTDVRVADAVDNLLRLLTGNDIPFGGVLMIMGGDWRQILPIVEGVRGRGVQNYTLKSGELWKQIEKFRLTVNKRAEKDKKYAEMILQIGNGTNYVDPIREMVFIPMENIERRSDKALADWVFPDVYHDDAKTSAILTVDNKTALRLNEYVLGKLENEPLRTFNSTDIPDKDSGLTADPSVFASETPSGMPPHQLNLKIGAQVVLLRNISVEQGLCNGTRMTVKQFGEDIIHFTVNNPTARTPPVVYLHRMLMTPSGKGAKSCGFRRLQYPIRLAYACTINKSQGQTLTRCGLVVHSPIFAHGQLYVAMSRVQKGEDFKIYHYKRTNYPGDDDYKGGMLVRNVVYKDVLRDETVNEKLKKRGPSENAVVADKPPPARGNYNISSSESDDSFDNFTTSPPANPPTPPSKNASPLAKRLKLALQKVVKPRQVQRPVLRRDGPYLLLKNIDNDCFLNALCNMLFNCPEIRDKYINCMDQNRQPFGFQLGRIFRREVTDARDLRSHFPLFYQKEQHCIREVFTEILVKTLKEEDKQGIDILTVDHQTGACPNCQTPNNQRLFQREPFSAVPLVLPRDSTFEDCFQEYVAQEQDTLCHHCGLLNYPVLTNSHLIVEVHQFRSRFTYLSKNSTFEMFGAEYRLRALAEYEPWLADMSKGHYRSWVRDGSDWVCVSDQRLDETAAFYEFYSSLLVFEKI